MICSCFAWHMADQFQTSLGRELPQVAVRVMYYTGIPLGILKTSAGLRQALTAAQLTME